MRYVSAIYDIHGEPLSQLICYADERNLHADICSLDTGIVERLPIDALKWQHDILGLSVDLGLTTTYLVRLTKRDAILHKYIESIKCDYLVRSDGNVDYWYSSSGIMTGNTDGTGREDRVILMSFSTATIDILEGSHSVVRFVPFSSGSNPTIFSLYDFLIFMARLSGVDIMFYGVIHIRSGWEANNRADIIFSKSKEAKRFFAKMAIDAKRSS